MKTVESVLLQIEKSFPESQVKLVLRTKPHELTPRLAIVMQTEHDEYEYILEDGDYHLAQQFFSDKVIQHFYHKLSEYNQQQPTGPLPSNPPIPFYIDPIGGSIMPPIDPVTGQFVELPKWAIWVNIGIVFVFLTIIVIMYACM